MHCTTCGDSGLVEYYDWEGRFEFSEACLCGAEPIWEPVPEKVA